MKRTPRDYACAYLAATENASREEARARAETLIALLRREGRLSTLPAIIAAAERASEDAGTVRIMVTAARALSDKQKQTLAMIMGIDRGAMLLEEHSDPAIGSGVRVRIGDRIVDMTLDVRLARLRTALLA